MVGCVGWLGGFYSVCFSLHLDKPDDLAGLPNYLKILKTLEEQGEVEGDDGKEVYHIHRRPDELQLARTAGDSHEVLNGDLTKPEQFCEVGISQSFHVPSVKVSVCCVLK